MNVPDLPAPGMQLAGPDGRVIAARVLWARSRKERRRGLLDLPPLKPCEAMVIERAFQVHTFGMSYAIDVVFCDRRWVVKLVLHEMQPKRVSRFVLSSRYAVELPSPAARGLLRGDRLQWVVRSTSGSPD